MKLEKARVQNYRSIIDTGEFEIEELKTIMVGPNEAGKTVILKALQQLHKPADVAGFEALRDYPRSMYNDISTGKVLPKNVTVVTGYFKLEEIELIEIQVLNFKKSLKLYQAINDSPNPPSTITRPKQTCDNYNFQQTFHNNYEQK